MVVEVHPRSVDAFVKIMGRSATTIGHVTIDAELVLPGVEPIPVGHLVDAFNTGGRR